LRRGAKANRPMTHRQGFKELSKLEPPSSSKMSREETCLLARRQSVFRRTTLHLTILMAWQMSMGDSRLGPRGRSGKLLILRLTPRGLRRLRLEATISSRSSSNTAS